MVDNTIFKTEDIEDIKKPDKPKRKLTQKQLDALARGREKQKAKREAKKGILKKEKEAVKENKALKKEQKKDRKVKILEQEKAINHLNNLRTKKREKEEDEKINRFSNIVNDFLGKTKNEDEYNKLKEEIENIPRDVLLDDEKLKNYGTELIKSKYLISK